MRCKRNARWTREDPVTGTAILWRAVIVVWEGNDNGVRFHVAMVVFHSEPGTFSLRKIATVLLK